MLLNVCWKQFAFFSFTEVWPHENHTDIRNISTTKGADQATTVGGLSTLSDIF